MIIPTENIFATKKETMTEMEVILAPLKSAGKAMHAVRLRFLISTSLVEKYFLYKKV